MGVCVNAVATKPATSKGGLDPLEGKARERESATEANAGREGHDLSRAFAREPGLILGYKSMHSASEI